ncbi:hypothetical protein [Vulcanisaeta sp. JCM 14467]
MPEPRNLRIMANLGKALVIVGALFIFLSFIGLLSAMTYVMPPLSFIITDLGLLVIGLIYLAQGSLVIRAAASRYYAVLAVPVTAIAIGAVPGILIGTMDLISLEVVIILIVFILTVMSIYALIRMIMNYGLNTMAMLSIGLVAVSLGMPLMLAWSRTAGGVIMAVGLALIAMGLQEHLNRVGKGIT